MIIISGGQTGVDRAALDAARESQLLCTGWCPKGRLAVDGPLGPIYTLHETDSTDYAVRTRRNIEDTDGTLILVDRGIESIPDGTLLTQQYARETQKFLLVVDICIPTIPMTNTAKNWIIRNKIYSLNIAGPREATCPGIYEKAKSYLLALFKDLRNPKAMRPVVDSCSSTRQPRS
jgi:hypothetical protein